MNTIEQRMMQAARDAAARERWEADCEAFEDLVDAANDWEGCDD